MRTIRLSIATAGVILVIVCSALLAVGASALPGQPASAKAFLASAGRRDRHALDDLAASAQVPPAVLALIRASELDLNAALDTLGAAELEPEATAAIRLLIATAAAGHRRALRRSESHARLQREVKSAYRQEKQAADLLGDAPGKPAITELEVPLALFGAFDLALGRDGQSLWVCGSDASRILLYPSLAAGAQPLVFKLAPGSYPHGIVVGPDDALYVAETGTNIGGHAIARLTRSGDRHEFRLPTGLAGAPWGIAVGPDRKIWFTEVGAGKIGRLDPATGKLVEYWLPTPDSQPQGIVSGPGGALWGTEANGNRIFRISVDGHATEFRIPTPRSVPVSIAAGRDGFVWVSEFSSGKLLRVSGSGRMREFRLPAGGRPYGLSSAPDGNVWFTDRGRNAIGVVTPAGRIVEYPLPTPNAQPTAIVPFALGAFAFSEFVGNRIGIARFETG